MCHSYSFLLVTAGSTSVANGSDAFDPTLEDVPGCEEPGGLAHDAHARRSTGENDVAREQRQDSRERRDQLRNSEDKVARSVTLDLFAVKGAAQLQVVGIRELVDGDEQRPDRAVAP